jgi:hypothetical protein
MNEQIQPQQVRHVLLGSEVTGSYSWLDFNAEIRRGLPVDAVKRLAQMGYTDLMVDGAPSPHQSDTTLRWLIDRLRS